MSALTLPHTHENFPFAAILHAMCALGTVYLNLDDGTLNGNYAFLIVGNIDLTLMVDDLMQTKKGSSKSVFAMQQIKTAKNLVEEAMAEGLFLIECHQGTY
jgi:hypothetical protein